MNWWNTVAGLSPVAAFDARHMESTYLMTDLSGGGNHANTGNQPSGSKVTSPTNTLYAVVGNGSNVTHTRITTPASGLLFAMVSGVNPRVMLFSDYDGPNGSPHALLIDVADTSAGPLGTVRNAGAANQQAIPDSELVKVVAIAFDGVIWRFYYNGAWLGAAVGADFASTLLPTSVGSSWPSYWGWNCSVSCWGMFSGTATLADIQAMEAQARIEFAGPTVGAVCTPLSHAISPNGSQGRQPGAPNARSAVLPAGRLNTYFSGAGVISGTTTIDGIPGARKVRLFVKSSGLMVAETWSNSTGAYSFTHLDPALEYFVVAHDHKRVYNAVVQDMLVAAS